ncbi:PAS domain-containing protein [Arcobacter sp. FWKO B]|nr:PAS domain-containing protein [Arcobacter sp. FWKO B]
MPKGAFEDLWKSVKSGNIWTGYVKNKTKNNEYYWVYATVYPFQNCQGEKGYLSCRRKATYFEIQQAKLLYSTM